MMTRLPLSFRHPGSVVASDALDCYSSRPHPLQRKKPIIVIVARLLLRARRRAGGRWLGLALLAAGAGLALARACVRGGVSRAPIAIAVSMCASSLQSQRGGKTDLTVALSSLGMLGLGQDIS
jgi:hypothetical protein